MRREHIRDGSRYTYDDKAERVVKYGLEGPSQLYQNGAPVYTNDLKLFEYKLYPNPYITVSSTGQYTKHYFDGTRRFASRLMDDANRFEDPSVLWTSRSAQNKAPEKAADTESDFKKYLEKTGLGDEVSVELREVYQRTNLYYLHGDHLGTATFVTNSQGETPQFFLNLPFGETMLEQMDGTYNNPYKFNAKELDEDTGLYYYGARYYNPRLSIWYGVDPLTEKMPNWSPYVYAFDNPVRFIDPDGREPLDDITVNKFGKITNVVKNNKPNRFFDESGKELFFNDPKGVDKINLESGAYKKGDQLFNYIPKGRFTEFMKAAGFDALRYNLRANQALKDGDKDGAMSNRYTALGIAKKESYDKADFAISTLIPNYSYPEYEINRRRPYLDTMVETADYFKFGDSNTIYNLYDAGNYMWGSWMHLNGFDKNTVKFGSNLNELMRGNMGDTAADQKSIFDGYYFKGYAK